MPIEARRDDYLEINRRNWDERAPAHAASKDYAVERFAADPDFLSDVVRFDLPRLGDVRGLTGVHLQCHIGTDTVSLARLGARMTGLDFSPVSLQQARALAHRIGADVDFVDGDVHDAIALLGPERFDLVYTGVGALCWLPSIERWADVVVGLLRPGGRLFVREGHPMLWAIDESRDDGLLVPEYPYFEHPDPFVDTDGGTYVETDTTFETSTTHSWNHSLGETVTALLDRGMTITGLAEHDSVPWESLPGRMIRGDDGEWRLAERPERVAQSYTLQAQRT